MPSLPQKRNPLYVSPYNMREMQKGPRIGILNTEDLYNHIPWSILYSIHMMWSVAFPLCRPWCRGRGRIQEGPPGCPPTHSAAVGTAGKTGAGASLANEEANLPQDVGRRRFRVHRKFWKHLRHSRCVVMCGNAPV